MILCVLVSSSRAQEADAKKVPCDITTQDSTDLTLNCSRRNIDEIPANWPERINNIDKGNATVIKGTTDPFILSYKSLTQTKQVATI